MCPARGPLTPSFEVLARDMNHGLDEQVALMLPELPKAESFGMSQKPGCFVVASFAVDQIRRGPKGHEQSLALLTETSAGRGSRGWWHRRAKDSVLGVGLVIPSGQLRFVNLFTNWPRWAMRWNKRLSRGTTTL